MQAENSRRFSLFRLCFPVYASGTRLSVVNGQPQPGGGVLGWIVLLTVPYAMSTPLMLPPARMLALIRLFCAVFPPRMLKPLIVARHQGQRTWRGRAALSLKDTRQRSPRRERRRQCRFRWD